MIERQTINIDNFLQKDRSSKYPKYCFLSSSAALTSQCTFYQEKIQAQQQVNFFIQSQRQLSTILCSDWMKQFFFLYWMKQLIVDSLPFLDISLTEELASIVVTCWETVNMQPIVQLQSTLGIS